MSSMHYKKGRKKVIQRFFAPFLWKSPFMVSSSSSLLVFWVFSTVSLPHKETDECFPCLSLCKIQSFTFLSQVPSWAALCTFPQQTKSYCLFLLQFGFGSDKNESQNGITAFRTHFVSQRHGVGNTEHFTAPAGKTNEMFRAGNFVWAQLQPHNGKISTWAAVGSSCSVHLACYLF